MPEPRFQPASPEGAGPSASTRGSLIAELEKEYSGSGILRRRIGHRQITTRWYFLIRFLQALRRSADFVTALLLILLMSPLLVTLYLVAKAQGEGIATRRCMGRWGQHFEKYRFAFGSDKGWRGSFLRDLPVFFNILKGQMSVVGPRPAGSDDVPLAERIAWKRYDIRPGLINLWWIRRRANIGFTTEAHVDAEYAETHSFWGDVGIVFRALPALAYGEGAAEAPDEIRLLGLHINNLTMAEASEYIGELAASGNFHHACFVNADCVNVAFRDAEYKDILRESPLVLADGIGVRLAGKLLNQNIRENVNGTDMLPYLCAELEKRQTGLYLLGGRPGVPEAAAEWIMARYPALRLCGLRDGYFLETEREAVIGEIRASGAKVLLVAMGVPRQEKWIREAAPLLGPMTCIGVGGLFDFYSGRIPRAPIWMRELGFEWLYRFSKEPRRMWRRYFVGNAVFLYRVLAERWAAKGATVQGEIAE
jgi:N-acetylglucosaminyldiphosphoundecaprenol N-acetyl-beta-D-mannosaminyltransferase